jgi:hypothetical protein
MMPRINLLKRDIRVRRLEKAARGICRDCREPAVAGRMLCAFHREKAKEVAERYRATSRGQEMLSAYHQKRHAERKAKAFCTTCGKAAASGFAKCNKCRDADARNEVDRKNQRIAAGLCIYCGQPVRIGVGRRRTSCDDCRKRRKGYDGTLRSRFSRARSAKHKKYGWSLHFEEFNELVSQPCTYCRLDNTTDQGCGLDRLDNKKGYHLGNVVSCCPECNMVRNNIFTPEEMKILGEAVRQIKLMRERR